MNYVIDDIYGNEVENGVVVERKVGRISSQYLLSEESLDDHVVVELFANFSGVKISISDYLTMTRTFCPNMGMSSSDVVSPIVIVTSSERKLDPIYALVSGRIAKILPAPLPKGIVSHFRSVESNRSQAIDISVIVPGDDKNCGRCFQFRLPPRIFLSRKLIYIKNFDIYLTGDNVRFLEGVVDRRKTEYDELVRSRFAPNNMLGSLHLRGNVDEPIVMHYSVNGMISQVTVESVVGNRGSFTLSVGRFEVQEDIGNEVFSDKTNLHQFNWYDELGDIELLISANYDLLLKVVKTTYGGQSHPVSNSANVITQLQQELSAKEKELEQLKVKDVETNYRLAQEAHKTKREELKTKTSISDARKTNTSDLIKLGGTVIGTITLIVGAINKMQTSASTAKSLVEWAVPVLFKM